MRAALKSAVVPALLLAFGIGVGWSLRGASDSGAWTRLGSFGAPGTGASPPAAGAEVPPVVAAMKAQATSSAPTGGVFDLLAAADLHALDNPAPSWPRQSVGPTRGPRLRAKSWYVYDHDEDRVLTASGSEEPLPIASISKLAAALVWADAGVPDDTVIELKQEDKDFIQVTRSRLRVGAEYRAGDLFHSSLLSSDNRATAALMRSTGLSRQQFADAMNRRMAMLGIESAHFGDPTGLDENNVATARDAARLLDAALRHPRIAAVLTKAQHRYERVDRRVGVTTRSSNRLAHQEEWGVVASKTGFTNVAGSCLVMRAWVAGRPVTLAMLGARGVHTRYGDAVRIRSWLLEEEAPVVREIASAGPTPFRPWPGDGLLPHGHSAEGEGESEDEGSGMDDEGALDAEGGDANGP